MSFVLRTRVNPGSLAKTVRKEIRALNKEIAFERVLTMEEVIAKAVFARRFNMRLLLLLACVAMGMAAVGVYGVTAYSVSQRTHEIGIRMALGAQQNNVLWLIARQGMTLVFVGVTVGLAGTFALTRTLASQLYEIKASDPLTFFAGVLVLTGVALLGCYLPARRAARVDPVVALRYE